MSFLRMIFWVVLALVAIAFAMSNWHDVTIDLWAGARMAIKLPLLIALAVLLGYLPVWISTRMKLWRGRQRIERMQAALDQRRERSHRQGDVAAPEPASPF